MATFKRLVSPLVGIDLEAYKDRQMERRICALMSRANAPDPESYLALLRSDPEKLQEFVDGLTINVSEWFRNPDKFRELEREILPELLARFPRLKVWSAGCSIGAEIYSVLILLDRLGALPRCDLLGTDLDEKALAQAREARYLPHEQKGLGPEVLRSYFEEEPGGAVRFNPSLARRVRFERHNLLSEPPPEQCHLVLCRNVVIYFNEASKATIHRALARSLEPGGYLFVGSTERIFHYRERGFDLVRSFFYRKG